MRGALRSPVFAPLAPWLARLPAERLPGIGELNALVPAGAVTGGGAPLRFAAAAASRRRGAEPYESRVFRTGEVPTREANWHDLFNCLAWLAFPRAKAAINRLHWTEMESRGGAPGARGTVRDALTLFDEGGVIVASDAPALLALVGGFRFKTLFWEKRAETMRRMRFFAIGHALHEKALGPYKGITAKSVLLEVPSGFLALDAPAQLAQADLLAAQWLARPGALDSTRNLAPLPVAGIPGWADNEREAYYDDVAVFRPGWRR
ncbi:MAG: DUF3025 domain-containing protein [Burkholderiales bacterium]|nr:DUF3025 domain-containing protein [Burkholderiales bacterium]